MTLFTMNGRDGRWERIPEDMPLTVNDIVRLQNGPDIVHGSVSSIGDDGALLCLSGSGPRALHISVGAWLDAGYTIDLWTPNPTLPTNPHAIIEFKIGAHAYSAWRARVRSVTHEWVVMKDGEPHGSMTSQFISESATDLKVICNGVHG